MSNELKERLLKESKTIAVVGLSSDATKDSYIVAKYLQDKGYRIIPVNPSESEVLGEKSYPDLASIKEKVDLVDIFRRPQFVMPIVEEAIQIGAKAVWMQNGIVNDEAGEKAKEAGLEVVMNDCTMRTHRQLSAAGVI